MCARCSTRWSGSNLRDNAIAMYASDNGPEFIRLWDGWAGPWRGQHLTALKGDIREPFLIRWPGKVPAGKVRMVSPAVTLGVPNLFNLYTNPLEDDAKPTVDSWSSALFVEREDYRCAPAQQALILRMLCL
jgi:hypothetical protein